MPWYTVDNVDDVPSPALLVYPERVAENIRAALRIVGEARRLLMETGARQVTIKSVEW